MPVMIAAREGLQIIAGAWAFAKTMPCAASRSMFGVCVWGWPSSGPTQSLRSSIDTNKIFGRSAVCVHPGTDDMASTTKTARTANGLFIDVSVGDLSVWYRFHWGRETRRKKGAPLSSGLQRQQRGEIRWEAGQYLVDDRLYRLSECREFGFRQRNHLVVRLSQTRHDECILGCGVLALLRGCG